MRVPLAGATVRHPPATAPRVPLPSGRARWYASPVPAGKPERSPREPDAPDELPGAIARFIAHLQAERRASPHTASAYRSDLDQLAAFVRERRGAIRLAGLDVLLLRGWLGQLARTHSPASVARKIAAARALLRWLQRHGEVEKNAAEELALPKVRRPLPTFLNVDAAAEVMTAPDADSAEGLRDRPQTSETRRPAA